MNNDTYGVWLFITSLNISEMMGDDETYDVPDEAFQAMYDMGIEPRMAAMSLVSDLRAG